MAQNFIACDREQALLLPPSLRDWLPAEHLAWFVLDAVEQIDLTAFYAAYRADGHGRAAHDPAMMVALVLYAYAVGERSSRGIERRCVEDVAFRVVAANQAPDHTTVNRFRARHQDALGDLFGEVLGLCAQAGLVSVGVVAIDGTKLHANASRDATLDSEQIAREILEEAKAVDAAEDELYGEARGDELPPELTTAQGRRKWLREAQRRLDDKRAAQARPVARGTRPRRDVAECGIEFRAVEHAAPTSVGGDPPLGHPLAKRPSRDARIGDGVSHAHPRARFRRADLPLRPLRHQGGELVRETIDLDLDLHRLAGAGIVLMPR